jgi:hypothetical protein
MKQKTKSGKGYVHPRTGNERPEEEQRYNSTLSWTSDLCGSGDQRYGPAALSSGKRPGIHFIGGWVGLKTGLDGCRKIDLQPGFDPRTVQPVAGRCTNWAIPARKINKV